MRGGLESTMSLSRLQLRLGLRKSLNTVMRQRSIEDGQFSTCCVWKLGQLIMGYSRLLRDVFVMNL